jgi:hypothetical protein
VLPPAGADCAGFRAGGGVAWRVKAARSRRMARGARRPDPRGGGGRVDLDGGERLADLRRGARRDLDREAVRAEG